MTAVERIAEFALRARWEMLSEEARQALKIRVLDSLESEQVGTLMRLLGAVRRAVAPQEMGESPWARDQQANPASAPSDS